MEKRLDDKLTELTLAAADLRACGVPTTEIVQAVKESLEQLDEAVLDAQIEEMSEEEFAAAAKRAAKKIFEQCELGPH